MPYFSFTSQQCSLRSVCLRCILAFIWCFLAFVHLPFRSSATNKNRRIFFQHMHFGMLCAHFSPLVLIAEHVQRPLFDARIPGQKKNMNKISNSHQPILFSHFILEMCWMARCIMQIPQLFQSQQTSKGTHTQFAGISHFVW